MIYPSPHADNINVRKNDINIWTHSSGYILVTSHWQREYSRWTQGE